MKKSISKYVKSVLVLLLAFTIVFHLGSTKGYACSCVEPLPVKEEVQRSTAVFTGKVINIKEPKKFLGLESSADLVTVTLEVEKAWKGINQTKVMVYTERISASCGFEFTLNEEYLVYAQKPEGKLKVSLCSRTTPLSDAKTDLKELGHGKIPTEQISMAQINSEKSNYKNLIFTILFTSAVLVILIYLLRKKKKKKKKKKK